MASTTAHCGIDNSLSLPSDPSNSSSITALAALEGIQVTWDYPALNPHAVAHTKLYRGVSAAFSDSSLIGHIASNRYLDYINDSENGVRYFYWIVHVSVNATEFAPVGPASAVAGSITNNILELLSNQINESHIAEALRTRINQIESLRSEIIDETTGRLNALIEIEATLDQLGIDLSVAQAGIHSATVSFTNANESFAQQLNAVVASTNQNAGAIVQEQSVRATAIGVVVQSVDTLAAKVGTDIEAAITDERIVRAAAEQVITQSLNTQIGRIDENFSGIQQINQTITNFDFASASSVTQLEAEVALDISALDGTIDGRITTEASSIVEDSLVAQVGYCLVDGVPDSSVHYKEQCELPTDQDYYDDDNNLIGSGAGGTWLPMASIGDVVRGVQISSTDQDGNTQQLNLQTQMTAYENEIGDLQGEYTVKLQESENGVDKIIGGFGLATEADATISAHFDVDTFSIGKLGIGNDVHPFIVVGDEVYMNSAYIENLSVDTLKLAGNAVSVTQSDVYFSLHAMAFLSENTDTIEWKYSTDNSDHLVEFLVDVPNLYPSGNGFQWTSISTGGLTPAQGNTDIYELTITVSFEFLIRTSTDTSLTYFDPEFTLVQFAPQLVLRKNASNNTTDQQLIEMHRIMLRVKDAGITNTAQPYTFTTVVTVDPGTDYYYRLWGHSEFIGFNTDLGVSNPPKKGRAILSCVVKNPTYVVQLLKR